MYFYISFFFFFFMYITVFIGKYILTYLLNTSNNMRMIAENNMTKSEKSV